MAEITVSKSPDNLGWLFLKPSSQLPTWISIFKSLCQSLGGATNNHSDPSSRLSAIRWRHSRVICRQSGLICHAQPRPVSLSWHQAIAGLPHRRLLRLSSASAISPCRLFVWCVQINLIFISDMLLLSIRPDPVLSSTHLLILPLPPVHDALSSSKASTCFLSLFVIAARQRPEETSLLSSCSYLCSSRWSPCFALLLRGFKRPAALYVPVCYFPWYRQGIP